MLGFTVCPISSCTCTNNVLHWLTLSCTLLYCKTLTLILHWSSSSVYFLEWNWTVVPYTVKYCSWPAAGLVVHVLKPQPWAEVNLRDPNNNNLHEMVLFLLAVLVFYTCSCQSGQWKWFIMLNDMCVILRHAYYTFKYNDTVDIRIIRVVVFPKTIWAASALYQW